MCRLSASLTESKRLQCNCCIEHVNQAARHTCRRTFVLPSAQILLSFFFFGQLPSELAEWNSGYPAKTGHMLGSECDLKMHVRNPCMVFHPRTNRETKNHHLSTTSQLNGNFNGLYLRSETWYRQSGKRVDMRSSTSSQNVMTPTDG